MSELNKKRKNHVLRLELHSESPLVRGRLTRAGR